MIKCGLCGQYLSETHKKGITYYRCDKRNLSCKNIKRAHYPTESEIEDQLMTFFEGFEINQEGWEKAKEYVVEQNQPQKINLNKQIRQLEGELSAEKEMQIKIGRRFSKKEISKSDYDTLIKGSCRREASLIKTIVKCEDIARELDKLMDNFLENIKYVTKRLKIALPENKRELVSIFCENFIWKDGKPGWEWKKPYYFWIKNAKSLSVLPL